MKTLNVELLGDEVNAAVMRLPGRKFPGLLIQGDSLSNVLGGCERALTLVDSGEVTEARQELQELVTVLSGYLREYEAALRREGISPPYYRKQSG